MKNYLRSNWLNLSLAGVIIAAFALVHFGVIGAVDPAIGLLLVGATGAFPVNAELTAIAVAYKNPADVLIADAVMPRVPTPKKFTYSVFTPAQSYTVPDTKVGRKSEPNMVDFGGTLTTAECLDYGLDDLVPLDEVAAWESMPKPAAGGPPSPQMISSMMLSHLVQLDREVRVAGTVFNTNNYLAGNQATLSGTSQWSDFTNSNPLLAIASALDIPLVRPNTLVIGQQAWTQLRSHPKIAQAVGRSAQTAGYATREQIAQLLELNQILVGQAFYNTAKKGQTASYSRAWGKHASLLHIDTLAAQIGQPTYGWTAQWGTRIAGTIQEPKKGLRGGETVRVGESVVEVVVCQDAGYWFQNAVA